MFIKADVRCGSKTGKAQREQMFSALPLKPDIVEYGQHVRLVPERKLVRL
jgi:hypothetical protein